jgi:NADH dehydrogenase FAD-containing subunit
MKSIDDAIIVRNHIINVLEQASLEEDNVELRTFVVAGGGFNGVETVGAINDFIRDSIKDYYKNIQSEVREGYQKINMRQTKHLTEINSAVLLATNIIEKMIKIAVLTAIEAPLYEEKSRKE